MRDIAPALSFWLILANINFFLAAISRDLLMLRSFLLSAYICLFMNSLLGLPPYLEFYNPDGPIAIDGMTWCVAIGVLHGYAVWSMYRDEADVVMSTDEEVIWRLFHRRSGVNRMAFIDIMDLCETVEFAAGETIANGDTHRCFAYFVLEGVVENSCVVDEESNAIVSKRFSGSFLAVHLFGVFGVKMGVDYQELDSVAATRCRLLVFSLDALLAMARRPPLVSAWKNLLLYQLAHFSIASISQHGRYDCSTGEEESQEFYIGAKSKDFNAFTEEELAILDTKPKSCLHRMCKRVVEFFNALSPFLPRGVRHTSPSPLHGVDLKYEIIAEGKRHSPSPSPFPGQPSEHSFGAAQHILRHTLPSLDSYNGTYTPPKERADGE